MYAIVETGGKQYRVKPGDTVAVERLSGEPGETLDFDRVLLVAGNGDDPARVGSPGVEGAVVRAEVVEQFRGEKIVIFRYKSKVRYRRKTGHRQSLTRLRITDILLNGESSVSADERRREASAEVAPLENIVPEPVSAPAAVEPAWVETPTGERVELAAADDILTSAGEGGPAPDAEDASASDKPDTAAPGA